MLCLNEEGYRASWRFALGGRVTREGASANGTIQNRGPPSVAALGLVVKAERRS
jgi:hypothetical protein